MVGIARRVIVAVSYAVERLRRVPGVSWVLRRASLVSVLVAVAAGLAFVWWASQAAPQRVGLADLVQAKLSPLQSWIVISGDMTGGEFLNGTYRYELTDPNVPNARLKVLSEVTQQLGATTISGTYTGTSEPLPVGFRWIGTMHADAVLTPDPGPPWTVIVLVVVALCIGLSGRFRYPAFFGETPSEARPVAASLPVGVRRAKPASVPPVVPGTVRVEPGAPVGLRVGDAPEQPLRLFSAAASVEVGTIQSLSRSEPALRVHQPTSDVDLIFRSATDRDVTYAALADDSRPRPSARLQ